MYLFFYNEPASDILLAPKKTDTTPKQRRGPIQKSKSKYQVNVK